ncbi:MAG: cell division protein FtsA [Symbiobacteriia bacterium]
MRRDIITALDAGSSKVSVTMAEVRADRQLHIIGTASVPSEGIKRGALVDIEGAARAISLAASRCQRMAGTSLGRLAVSLSGTHVASFNNRALVSVARPGQEITPEDVHRAMDAARVVNLPGDRELVHVLPRQFLVDGYEGIRDPVGMMGSRLEVEAHMVTASGAAIQNLLKAVIRAGLEAEQVILSSLAAAESTLTQAEREAGVILVDLGGGTTDVAVFLDGSPAYTCVLPVGSDHITSDLAMGLRIPLGEAERLKLEYGITTVGENLNGVLFELPSAGSGEPRPVTGGLLADIIEPRVQELFNLVLSEVRRAGVGRHLPGGLVLTGGGARLKGLDAWASRVLEMPVRVGEPQPLAGLADTVRGPEHAAVVGLVQLALARRSRSAGQAAAAAEGMGVWARLRGWFQELF